MNAPLNLDDGLEMAVTGLKTTAAALTLSYTVRNRSGHDAYLVNRLFHRGSARGFKVDTNLVYAALAEELKLELRKQMLLVPEGKKVETPEVPYATRLTDGAEFTESVNIPLPVAPHDAYEPQPRRAEPIMAEWVVFSLGYVVADEPLDARQVKLASGKREWRVGYEDLYERQRLKVTAPIRAEVPTIAALPA